MVTDGLGNPLHFLLYRGNQSDIGVVQELLSPFNLLGKLVLADKGYDSEKLADWIRTRGGITVIPSRCSARHPRKIDWDVYKERHLIENLFLKLKNYRRFSIRYKKKALYFYAVIALACNLSLVTLTILKQSLDFITKVVCQQG